MPELKIGQLVEKMRRKNYDRVYYFYGKDITNILLYSKGIAEKLVPSENKDFNLHIFKGNELDIGELNNAVFALPVFSEHTCVMINDLDAAALTPSELKELISIISDIPPETVLIIYNTGFSPIPDGKKAPNAANKKLIDAVSKSEYGVVCNFVFKKSYELVKPIIAAAQKYGCTISSKNAELLATLCLCDNALIANELDKLCAYCAEREITAEDINLLVTKQLDTTAFSLANAVISFNAKQSMTLLDELFARRTEEVAIVSALSMSFLDIYRAVLATVSGRTRQNVIDDFKYRGREFAVNNAFQSAASIDIKHLRRCIEILNEADRNLKSSRMEGRLILEKAITEMLIR